MSLQDYLEALDPPDVAVGRRLALHALDHGMASETYVDEVLVPAQIEVGRRWHSDKWTIAQEHAATAISDAVLATLANRDPTVPTVPGRLVSCCAEGEWHSLPLRMLNDAMARSGHDIVSLGPSVPASQLTDFVRTVDPVAVLVNCSVAINLVGARRTIAAAHEAGAPVILGGRALGNSPARASAIGADAWAPDATAAAAIVAQWTNHRPDLLEAIELHPEQVDVELPSDSLIEACTQGLLAAQPRLRTMTEIQLRRTREDIAYILRFCAASLVTQDPTVLDEFTVWLRDLLAPRGVPPATIKLSYEVIADVLGPRFPTVIQMLESSSTAL